MEGSRRSFLKLAGVCALGLGVRPAVNAFSADALSPPRPPLPLGRIP